MPLLLRTSVLRISTIRPLLNSTASRFPCTPYFSTFSRAMAAEFKLSVPASSLKNGGKAEAEVEGIEEGKVLLVKSDGHISALSAKCTHYGAPLVKGVFDGKSRLTCPWHGGA